MLPDSVGGETCRAGTESSVTIARGGAFPTTTALLSDAGAATSTDGAGCWSFFEQEGRTTSNTPTIKNLSQICFRLAEMGMGCVGRRPREGSTEIEWGCRNKYLH